MKKQRWRRIDSTSVTNMDCQPLSAAQGWYTTNEPKMKGARRKVKWILIAVSPPKDLGRYIQGISSLELTWKQFDLETRPFASIDDF